MTVNRPTSAHVLLLGCGDMARRLAPKLCARGLELYGLRRTQMPSSSELTMLAADAAEPKQLAAAMAQGFDIVVITLTPAGRSDAGYRRGYVQPVHNLLQLIDAGQVRAPELILFASSTGVYGQNDGSWVDELSPTEPARYSGLRLLEAEQLLAASPINTVAVRFAGIYGPGRQRLIERAQAKSWDVRDKAAWSNRIHIDDCAGVLDHLIAHHLAGQPLEPIYLAGDSNPTTSWDIKQWLARELGAIERPEAANYSGPMTNKRCSNRRLLASGYQFQYPDAQSGYRAVLDQLDPSTSTARI